MLFAVQALVNIGVNAGLFWVAINLIFLYTDFSATVAGNLAKVLSTIVAFGVSFFILRHLVFSGKPWRSRPHSQPVKEREDVGERESGPEIR